MPRDEQEKLEEKRRCEIAANVFRRLEENPDDIIAQQDRDDFLARGEAERATYRNLLWALKAVSQNKQNKPKPSNKLKLVFFFILTLGSALYFLVEPVSLHLTADERTGTEPRLISLASGDTVYLDGSSAITRDIDETARRLQLLSGAAYFDVTTDIRPFIVTTEELNVTVVGTKFEVTKFDEQIAVSVAEGEVSVSIDEENYTLSAGQRLRWKRHSLPIIDAVSITNIGSWRNNVLVTAGMTFGEVIQIVDRRLPGPIFVIGEDLSAKTFRGRLDLKDPLVALRALATTTGATVRSALPVGTLVSKQ